MTSITSHDLTDVKVRSEKYYSVGYCPKLKKYVLANCITWIAWYEDFYEISKQEYESFGSEALDNLANSLVNQTRSSSRFICSGRDH